MRRGSRGAGWGVVALTLLAGCWLAEPSPSAEAADGTPPAATGTSVSSTPTPGVSGTATPAGNASATPDGSAAATPGAAGTVTPTPAAGAAADQPAADPFRDREDRMALLLGRARVGAGLLPLARSAALDRAAVAHAQDMAARGYMEHEGPDGSTPGSRAAQEGYQTTPGSAWMVVETISAISDEPDGALGWWLSDGLHRRVVLRSYFRELGVGYAAGGPYGRFWVAEFGCRPNVLPPVLLDGMLAVPDEGCGHSPDAFGPVASVRAAETSAAVQSLDWQPYAPQQAWPAGHPAVVDMRDAAGHELEARAADPTGAATQAP